MEEENANSSNTLKELQLSPFDLNDTLSNSDDFQFQRENEIASCSNMPPLSSNFSGIDLSTCKNVQIGTKIITSNVTVLDPNADTFEGIPQKLKKNNFENITEKTDIYCLIGGKVCFNKLRLIICFVIILVLFIGISALYFTEYKKDNNTDFITSTKISQISSTQMVTTEIPIYNISWFVTREQWGALKAEPCDQNLITTNNVKLIYSFQNCKNFSVCRPNIQYEQQHNMNFSYGDIIYHYGIGEDGLLYEGRSIKCETVPIYRNCTDTFLLVQVFIGSNICPGQAMVKKQIESFNKLIEYLKSEGDIFTNNSLSLSIFKFCSTKYILELNKIYMNITINVNDEKDSC
ncbi:uncharacterized protein LOC142331072 isoform X1 [Lycorma delicatula]|uniref:uncharacterized protein LOC142331072 isoform X1 n=1 Tax=Lycorma delicatula TaxID=130591 RepID=UPI003F516DA8